MKGKEWKKVIGQQAKQEYQKKNRKSWNKTSLHKIKKQQRKNKGY